MKAPLFAASFRTEMSAPAQNARPLPVNTSTLTFLSARTAAISSPNSRTITASIELSLVGRLRRTNPIPLSSEYSKVRYILCAPPGPYVPGVPLSIGGPRRERPGRGKTASRAIQRAMQTVNLSIGPDPAILAWRERAGSNRWERISMAGRCDERPGSGVVRARALVLQQQAARGLDSAARSQLRGADGMGGACGSRRKRPRYAASPFRPAHRGVARAGHRHAGDVLVERRPAHQPV